MCGGTRERISVLAFPPSMLHTSPAPVSKADFNEEWMDVVMVKSNFLVSFFLSEIISNVDAFHCEKDPCIPAVFSIMI